MDAPEAWPTEVVDLSTLTPHPRNYKTHPPDQIEHLQASLREHGWYRDVVVADDGTILAGHGIWQAAIEAGWTHGPIRRLPVDPNSPAALRVVAGDNELPLLAERDDRLLTELLREAAAAADGLGLAGTGYDEMMLANLVMVTRPASEIADLDEAAEWVGLPQIGDKPPPVKLVVQFETNADRERFMEEKGLTGVLRARIGEAWSTWWPPRDVRDDANSVRVVQGDAAPGA